MRNRIWRCTSRFQVVLVATALILVAGCSEPSVAPVDVPAAGQSQEISISVISFEGDVDVLNPRLVSGAGDVEAPEALGRPRSGISFDLPEAASYTVLLFDVSGNVVFSVVGQGGPGTHNVQLDLSDKPSGIYVVVVLTGPFSAAEKFRVVK